MIHKLKNLRVLSNGSICFTYGVSNKSNKIKVFKEDNKNSILNIKKNKTQINFKTFSNYKIKYLKK